MTRISVAMVMTSLLLTGCGEDKTQETTKQNDTQVTDEQTGESEAAIADTTGADEASDVAGIYENATEQSAANGHIDFEALKAQNEEIFGWLYVPGADIDCPILQSQENDDYYRTHNDKKENDNKGAAFIEMPTMPDM